MRTAERDLVTSAGATCQVVSTGWVICRPWLQVEADFWAGMWLNN